MRVEQRRWTRHGGWSEPLSGAGVRNPQVVILFGARNALGQGDVLQALRALYPDARQIGCSTSGEISGVEVTDEAVAVRFGPTGWPQRRIPMDQIEAAEAIMVDPLKWGGWGYRWMPWAKASAAVIRKGPGIELQLKDGRRFAVTVNDSVAGAQTISALCSN